MGFNPIAGILKRRLLIVFLAIALLVAGVLAFRELPLQAYPGVAPLSVQAITQWPGRSTTEVEQQITIPIENALAGVPDVQSFRSVSLFGLSVVTLKFKEGTDGFKARQNFAQYVAAANLPTGVQPSLSPDSDATGEIMRFRLVGNGVDLTTLKSYQDYDITKELKHVQGVADVSSFGGKVKEYHIVPSPAKLQSYGITLSQLITAIGNANNNTGGNLLRDGEQQFVVRGVGLLQTVDDIRNVVVAANNGVPVRVRDIAEVEIGNVQRLGQVQYNDQPDVVEGIVLLKRDANASEVLAKVREKVTELNNGILPKSVQIKPFYDRQVLLDITMGTVEHTLVVGISLVLAVLFVFLGNFRAAAVVAAVIPLALCVSFISMEHFHVPANLISLGAIDFGVIVDAAVIVMENIMRHLEEGAEKLDDAIVKATSEVQRAMIFSTGIIIVAYSPLFFIGGVEGIIFKPMAFTMGFALMASIVLSLSFVPATTSFVFGKTLHPHSPAFITAILRWYKPLLRKLIARPMAVFATAITALVLTLYSATFLGTEFLPTLEENNLWLRITLPNTVDLDYSASVASDLRAYFVKQPEINQVSVQIGRPDDGTDSTGVFNQEYGLYFAPPDQWPAGMTKAKLVERLSKRLEKIPGIEYNFSQYIQDNVDEALSGVKGENSVKLFGNDLNALEAKANEIQAQLKKVPGLVDVGIFRELGQPTLNVSIDRQAAARFNINVSDVQNLVQYAIGGAPVTQILEGEKSFGLAVRLNQQARASYDAIRELLIDTPDGQHIPLSMIAKVEMTDGPFFIYRELGKRYIAIKFGVRGRDLGSAVEEAQHVVGDSVQLPEGYTVKWDGQFNEMKVAQSKLMVIVPLTILVIFLLLYSTFGNFKDALMVVLNVPFAAIGGLLALHIAHETLSISAGIGFLSLFGIAIQDGVILISYVNRLAQSDNVREATVDGAALRLRPVIMTAMLAGLGLLPAALSHSIGSEAQRPLALVIVGGMVTTTILTLLVLPVVFTWAHRHRRPPSRDSDVNPTAAMLP
ncbi:Cobalt-zinc-cadmium resistance protein CzcA [Ralstonia wenshanensis]|uniref:efflux RND transporter permease subunit n=1 Tax=Ralstonia wenshanensis TaxID=2842456 RepID=UPI0028F618E2|nr:CusA/CzcA family heavy metal efflux RND transporter [Ralstonia wenshanensis]CAJ0814349.1 Cobalt-zinc-cadmium resistance protein CzcA [Ralstonia wenshanensis]